MSEIKQLYKIENGALVALKQNDIHNGAGVSNLDRYFSEHIAEAAAAGWYELAEVEPPECDAETQCLESSYEVVGGKIQTTYIVKTI